jgi:Flp pilus assembly pilin Flp
MFELRRDGLRARAIRPARSHRGQSFVEYALIIVFVALAIVAALALLGPQIAGIFDTINSAF